jgi:hypothetical protein
MPGQKKQLPKNVCQTHGKSLFEKPISVALSRGAGKKTKCLQTDVSQMRGQVLSQGCENVQTQTTLSQGQLHSFKMPTGLQMYGCTARLQ